MPYLLIFAIAAVALVGLGADKCEFKCSALTDKERCDSDIRCQWNDKQKACMG